ncbi:ATP-dependent RNA helicase HrpA [Thalassoglobus polymorphus]|uniref:ATP-dependent RNA helicase HrpB n=1 Tax=Thalassoglobus polymorphus TaxID=2527994 RepID=A0A517QIR2_9PLAN|nr:ATP-dependent RNA helicase HrpA [Thalassoglobus polymorphus]QDT31514.1 ATP-dependent RNA helicase HrpB [Thalassoglobus polymorphus]
MKHSNSQNLEELKTRIQKSMIRDRFRLRRSCETIQQRQKENKPVDKSLAKLVSDLEKSERKVELRRKAIPVPVYDDQLPISARRDEIRKKILDNQVVVICGETGSGKSTQLPKICLEAGRGLYGIIGHTQPRRIAARSVAARVAEELKSPVGELVGFKIRFTDSTSPKTSIKLMTDGILLAETQTDRFLDQYDTIIIDEAHERSLNIDFLMGYLKRILHRRPDLKLIITSATIDAERFAEFFGTKDSPAPVIEVSGRTFPVELRYRPPVEEEDEVDWQRAAADACEELAEEGTGDILVFMPTERDIRETAKVLGGRKFAGDFNNRKTDIVPLFGRLSEKEQNKVFSAHDHRRIVIATNVAESSLTVPGIVYVVDPGTARISRFSATSQVQRLPIEAISQASANQRKGRCGRVAPGVCVRLYSEADFKNRDEYTQPEIQRTNLANVILQMKALKLGKLENFPFIDPPAASAIRTGLKTLFELGAINENEDLTKVGSTMGRLPVDPRIARMILGAEDEQCVEEVLIITSALELRDPRDRPIEKQKAADEAHEKFQHESSDFLSYLKLWDFYTDLDNKLSQSKLRKACAQNFLSFNRMREWKDLHRQLRQMVIDHEIKPTDRRNNEDSIHRAILAGLLHNVAMRGDSHEYTGAGGQKIFVWPGSVAFGNKPKWIMAAELVETSKRYARCVAPVQVGWIERIAEHIVKRNYSEPHWHEKSACIMAWEKVMLFGLPIVPRRRARYGHIDPKYCRDEFIQQGLIEGKYESPGEFAKHNTNLKNELEEWQAKLRHGHHFAGEEAEVEFYDQRLPADAFDGPRFEKWRKKAEAKQPRLLFLSKEDLLQEDQSAPEQSEFPDKLKIGTMQVSVEYNLQPGTENDGVTIAIPPEGLNQLSPESLAWLVPGLLEEKIAALIKTLPKSLRILFVPAPETAKDVVKKITYGQGNLINQLAAQLREISGEHVPATAFETARLPSHLQMNVRVVDQNGKTIASGRDLAQLRVESQRTASSVVQGVSDDRWKKEGLTSWNFGTLPQQVELERGGITVVAFPMLVDEGASVSLRLSESLADAHAKTKRGLVRLFLLSDKKVLTDQVQHFPRINQLTMQVGALPDGKHFQSHLAWMIAQAALWKETSMPRSEAQWKQKLALARNQLSVAVQDSTRFLEPLFARYHAVRRITESNGTPALTPLTNDLRDQLNELVAPGFLVDPPMGWLAQYPRYFEAMQIRWDKSTAGGFQKDRMHQKKINLHWQRWKQACQQFGNAAKTHPQLVQYRFLIEEFRVSLFAQQLGTAMTVSEKRLNEVWQEIASSRQ